MFKKPWLLYALTTTLFWGTWGALIEIPEQSGFPATLGYIVWSLTMIPCALVGLAIIKWKLDYDVRSVVLGSTIGFLGAGGQLALFHALVEGPAYLVFPIISLSPSVTVVLSVIFLKEKATKRHWIGIVLSLTAIFLMSLQKPDNGVIKGYLWLGFAVMVFLAWGTQAFYMKKANRTMKAESIFFYMMLTGLLLSPIAYFMTDMNQEINWSFRGPYFAAIIHTLNSIGALMLVYAIRYGKVIIVAPLTNAVAPIITIIISLLIYTVIPGPVIITGMVVAMIAAYLLAD
ncbi:MAG: DMT family transporter [Bacteroidota bacterium]